jgi:8-oxo-dGTP pyrophosphatase MutT (NUDIX family)
VSHLDGLELGNADPPVEPGVGRAAVAAVFGPKSELLFIHRAEREGDLWSGHMAFPGGREEPGDGSLRQTAVRETAEELGLDLSGARCLGALSPLHSPRNTPGRRLVVVPWVFELERWPELRPNAEVAGVVRFGFDRFVRGEARGSFSYPWQGADYELPCVRLDGTLLWGMTLRMVDELVERLGAR